MASATATRSAKGKFEIQLDGMDEVARIFNDLDLKVQKKILRPALRAGAKVLRESVRHAANAMLSKTDQPAPHVADTLKVKALKRDRSKKGRVGYVVITAMRGDLGIEKGDTYYPAHLEHGHMAGKESTVSDRARSILSPESVAAIEAQHTRHHVPAVPFMKVGLESGRAAAEREVGAEVERRLRATAGFEGESAEFTEDVSEEVA